MDENILIIGGTGLLGHFWLNSMSFENTVMLDGEPTTNKANLKRVY